MGKNQSSTYNGKVVKCNECDYQTTNAVHLKGHMTGHHNPYNNCKETFKLLDYSEDTWELYTGNVVKNNECDYQTTNTVHMRGHMTGHHNPCNDCKETFRTVRLLRRHVRTVYKELYTMLNSAKI